MSGRVVWQFRTLFLASVLRETGGEGKEGRKRERFNRVRVQRGVVVAFKKIADRRGMAWPSVSPN